MQSTQEISVNSPAEVGVASSQAGSSSAPAKVRAAADRLGYLQFLTIRQFLSLVFGALVTLLFLLMLVMLVWT